MTPQTSLSEGGGFGEDSLRAAQLAQEWASLSEHASAEPTPGEVAFSASLAGLAEDVSEIAESTTAIEHHGRELVRTLDIAPELFDNRANTLFLSALSQRSARLEEHKDTIPDDAYTAEKTFIFDAAVLLAGRRSGHYEDLKDLISREDTVSEAALAGVYSRFTNKQVTADLQKAIDNGLFAEVRQRLGIAGKEDEDPYVLHVLNVGTKDVLHGMNPASNIIGLTGDALREELSDVKAYEGYAAGLAANTKDFLQQTGRTELAMAWAIELDGVRHLCVALPTAEKLLYTDQRRSSHYRPEDHEREQAILEHEYAHTQGESLIPDHNIYYGISFEEVRAEQMSGNKHGYEDAKGFVYIDLQLMTSVDYKATITGSPRGGSASKFYVALAQRIGLQQTLEVALVVPEKYLEDTRPMQQQVNAYLGGYNGVLKRMYETASPSRQAQIDMVLAGWANEVKDNEGNEAWRKNRKSLYNLHYVTDRLEQAIAEATHAESQPDPQEPRE